MFIKDGIRAIMKRRTLLYRLFGVGRLPRTVRTAIEPEKIQILEEGIRVIVTYRNFRNSSQYLRRKKKSFSGAIAITSRRVVAYAFAQRVLNLPFRHSCFKKIKAGRKKNGCFFIRLDASQINDKASGTLEYRFITPKAGKLDRLITRQFGLMRQESSVSLF